MEYMEARMQDRYEALSEEPIQISATRPIVAEQQGGDPIWKTMDSAPKEPGMEIIAARFGIYAELTAMCEKSPFISFFMHSRGKFYGDPTHWLCKVPASFPSVRA